VRCVVVDDVQRALGLLARAVRDRLPELTVIGVTGSSGKTSTKDLLAQVLADIGPTVAPVNSFNNELGVPLTLLRCEAHTRFLVSELGAREPGNIAYLCGIVRPDLGVVLNVGAAHAGVFGTREATAATKGELVEALPPAAEGGVAVLNADDAAVVAMAARTAARVVLTSAAGARAADVRARDVRLDAAARPSFTLGLHRREVPVSLPVHGAHHVANALAVAAVADTVGLAPERIGALLGRSGVTSTGRMQVTTRPDGVVVIDDSYNANPDSMAAALAALVAMARPAAGGTGRSWAVLGEMLELGERSAVEHARIGRLAADLGVDRLVTVAEGARAYGTTSVPSAWLTAVDDVAAALVLLHEQLRSGDVVLVKASRAIGLDRLARALIEPAGESPELADLPSSGPSGRQDVARAEEQVVAGMPREVGA